MRFEIAPSAGSAPPGPLAQWYVTGAGPPNGSSLFDIGPDIPSALAQAPLPFRSCLAQSVSQRHGIAKMNTKIFKNPVPSNHRS